MQALLPGEMNASQTNITDAVALFFLDAMLPSFGYELVLRPAGSSTSCFFSAFTTVNYLYHNKL